MKRTRTSISELQKMLRGLSESEDENIDDVEDTEFEDDVETSDLDDVETSDLDDVSDDVEEEVNPWNESEEAPSGGMYICYSDGNVTIAEYDSEEGMWKNSEGDEVSVSHWMEIPEPPVSESPDFEDTEDAEEDTEDSEED